MTLLDDIVAHKHATLATLPDVADPPPCLRDTLSIFYKRPALIAELKAASPSEGVIDPAFNPLAIAAAYKAGGANALSVLTDDKYFGGSFDVLRQVRAATELPLLCKDFIISEQQVHYARVCGADMCLLIVKILAPPLLQRLKDCIEGLGMVAVVEVQTMAELETAMDTQPDVVMVNARDLNDFSMDIANARTVMNAIPDTVYTIAASGITHPADIKRAPTRADGFLIGTALMRAADKTVFLQQCRMG